MNLSLIKSMAGFVASFGSGMVISNAIKATTPKNISLVKKICIGVGSIAIADMVGDAASNYITKQIDETAEKVSEWCKEENNG